MKIVARHKFAPLVALDDGSVIDTEDLEVVGSGSVSGPSWEFSLEGAAADLDPRWAEIVRADGANLGVTERKMPKGDRTFRAPVTVRDGLRGLGIESPLTDGQGLTLGQIAELSENDDVSGPALDWMFGLLNKHDDNPDAEEEAALFEAAKGELDYDEMDAAMDSSITAAIEGPPGTFSKTVYVAVIAEDDTKSVQDLVALVQSPSGAADAFTYQGGKKGWQEAPDLLTKLQSPAPPPIKQLEDWQAESVMQQITTTGASDENESPAPAEDGQKQDTPPVQASAFELPEAHILWGPDNRQILSVVLAAGHSAGHWTGNAERLRQYWEHGKGAGKIRWGLHAGAYRRCVRHLEKYLGPRAHGYCALRFHHVTGVWPGSKANGGHGGHH